MPTQTDHFVITSGEPSGIGPDIILKLFHCGAMANTRIAVIGDINLLKERAQHLSLSVDIVDYNPSKQTDNALPVIHVANKVKTTPGLLSPSNSASVVQGITLATDLCLKGEFAAMITAPVHKGVINESGIPFSGHTEWIADRCEAELPVMMLASENMKVCLATTHLPLREVSEAITKHRLEPIIRIMHKDIAELYNIPNPVIGVCGLNPHAGESGHLGREEIEVISPVLDEFREKGMSLVGPLPADTAFTTGQLKSLDAVLAMYHDQGLPVIKHSDFGDVVNVTLGLPIIRTSVDHGTALDIAGTGKASETSLISAVRLAKRFAENKKEQ